MAMSHLGVFLSVYLFSLHFVPVSSQSHCFLQCQTYNGNLARQYQFTPGAEQPGQPLTSPFVSTTPAGVINIICTPEVGTCYSCLNNGEGSDVSGIDQNVLTAWFETCVTNVQSGADQAYSCWLSIPAGGNQCVQPNGGASQAPSQIPSEAPTASFTAAPTPNLSDMPTASFSGVPGQTLSETPTFSPSQSNSLLASPTSNAASNSGAHWTRRVLYIYPVLIILV